MTELLQEMRSFWSKKTRQTYRSFGLTMGIFLLLLGGVLWYFNWPGMALCLLLGALLTGLAQVSPTSMRPFYVVWMSLAVFLGFIMTRLLLSIIYYLVFSLVRLVFLFGRKDPLSRRYDPSAESYWLQRQTESYQRHFSEKQY